MGSGTVGRAVQRKGQRQSDDPCGKKTWKGNMAMVEEIIETIAEIAADVAEVVITEKVQKRKKKASDTDAEQE